MQSSRGRGAPESGGRLEVGWVGWAGQQPCGSGCMQQRPRQHASQPQPLRQRAPATSGLGFSGVLLQPSAAAPAAWGGCSISGFMEGREA